MNKLVFSLIKSSDNAWFLICLLSFEEDAIALFEKEGELKITRNIVETKKIARDFVGPMNEMAGDVQFSGTTGIYGVMGQDKKEEFLALMRSTRESTG